MRRLLLIVIAGVLALPSSAAAQRGHRAWLVVSDAFGVTGGGLSNTNGFSQMYRASATAVMRPSWGLELSAVRIREVFPAAKLANDPSLNNPAGDGLLLGYSNFREDGRRGFPSTAVLGFGAMRRETGTPGQTRVTGALEAGLESTLWRPNVNWFESTAGARLMLMPAGNRHQLYMLGLTLGFRFG